MNTGMKTGKWNRFNLTIFIAAITAYLFQPAIAVSQNKNVSAAKPVKQVAATTKATVTGYAPVNGLKLYYEIHGQGDPLVLLHGGLGSSGMFGDNLAALTKIRKVITVDLQAHGRTADIDRELNVEYMADDIAALLKHLNIEKADIMGYSMGGGVALQTAIRHPAVVRKLVVASTPFKRSAFYPEILAQQAQVGPEAAEMMKQTPMYQSYAAIAPRPQDWARLLTKIGEVMKKEYDWTESIKKVKAPTLVIAADADLFPPSHAVELFGLLGGGQRDAGWDGSQRPASQLAILPNTTHYNIFLSPSLFTNAVAFLNNTGQQPKW